MKLTFHSAPLISLAALSLGAMARISVTRARSAVLGSLASNLSVIIYTLNRVNMDRNKRKYNTNKEPGPIPKLSLVEKPLEANTQKDCQYISYAV